MIVPTMIASHASQYCLLTFRCRLCFVISQSCIRFLKKDNRFRFVVKNVNFVQSKEIRVFQVNFRETVRIIRFRMIHMVSGCFV